MSDPTNTSSGPSSNTRGAEQRIKQQEQIIAAAAAKQQDQRLKPQQDQQQKPLTPTRALPALPASALRLVGDILETAIKDATLSKKQDLSNPIGKDLNLGEASQSGNLQINPTKNRLSLDLQPNLTKVEAEKKEEIAEQQGLENDNRDEQVFLQSDIEQTKNLDQIAIGENSREEENQSRGETTEDSNKVSQISSVISTQFGTLNFSSSQSKIQSCFASGLSACDSNKGDWERLGPEQEESDEDLEMANRDIAPGHFSGLKSEDAEEWLHSILFWIQYKRLNDESGIAAAALLLRDGALQWFHSLDHSDMSSMRSFSDAFKRRYMELKADKWKDIVAVFELKQLPDQSVEDFIALAQKKGNKAQAAPEQLRAAIIKGLKPYVRQQVLQHEPKDIEEIRKWAIVAESTEAQEDRSSSSSELARAVEEMRKQSAAVRDLQEQIQKIHLRGLSWSKSREERSPSPVQRVRFNVPEGDRRESSSPQRRNFEDYPVRTAGEYVSRNAYPDRTTEQRSQESSSYDRRPRQQFVPQNQYRNQSYDRSDQSQRNQGGFGRSFDRRQGGQSGQGNNGAQPRANNWTGGRFQNQQNPSQYTAAPVQQTSYRSYSDALTGANQPQFQPDNRPFNKCSGCGGERTHPRPSCPAFSVICGRCGRGGHYMAVCRSVPRQ